MRAPLVFSLFLAAGGVALWLALGSRAPASSPSERLRLWTVPAELSPAARPKLPPAPPVLRADFTGGLDGWVDLFLPSRTDLADARIEKSLRREDGSPFLRLAGRHGGLTTSVPVEPSTCYRFSARARANALEVESGGEEFRGACFRIAEASAAASMKELLTTRKELVTAGRRLPSVRDLPGWQEQTWLFVTRPETHFLHLVCSLATRENVTAGSVDYADVRLDPVPLDEYWRSSLASAIEARADVDPPLADWQRARRVSALLGGEHRPSIVLLPGDRLRFSLGALPPTARLTFGFGPWRKTLIEGSGGTQTLQVRLGERELLTKSAPLPASAEDTRWDPVELDLAAASGKATTLEFACAGDAPLVLGAPLIQRGGARPSGPNLILISIDTLRADHVGAYGYAAPQYPGGTTPNLDALARTGLLCRDTSAQAPYTLPSHATLLTGQFPSVHGVVAVGRTLSAARSETLAETLARAGYTTQAFASGGYVKQDFGLDRGFEGFTEVDPIRGSDSYYLRTTLSERHGAQVAERLLREHGFESLGPWLEAHREQRFFVFLHTYTVHDADAPESYLRCEELGCTRPAVGIRTVTAEEAERLTPEQRAHVVHRYDAALRYTDERLGALLAELERLGLGENTLIAVTSDHGEEFFEHGALQHGRTLYEELLRVPLLFHGPGIAPGVIERPAMLADVTPTLLARLGFPLDRNMQGVDLLGADWLERPIWSEVDDRNAHKYALREEHGRKTIYGPPTAGLRFPNTKAWEQFDLARDPLERQDLSVPARDPACRTLELLREKLEQFGTSRGATGRGEIEPSTQQELDELGYGKSGR